MSAIVHCGDALEVLRGMESESVQCCVSSPPYWGLRQYLFDGAVRLRSDIDGATRTRVLAELEALNVRPRK